MEDCPGGAVDKNMPLSACQSRGQRFCPWSGKIPHAARQRSLHAATPEARMPTACAPQQEKPALTATRERLRRAVKTQHAAKNKQEKIRRRMLYLGAVVLES